jgi:hypothetical protein
MKLQRSLAALVVLAVLLPLAASAAKLCAMVDCDRGAMAAHDCCPPPAASVQSRCCDDGHDTAAVPVRADGPAKLALAQLQALELAPPSAPPSAGVVAPPAYAPRELLARHCVLRI